MNLNNEKKQMNELPEWLQKLWQISPMLARQAETDYIDLKKHSEQLRVSFNNVLQNDFDLLLLGNSRVYRGVNPDKLSVSSYNFSHDNDGFNQLYFKLEYLEKRNISYKRLLTRS